MSTIVGHLLSWPVCGIVAVVVLRNHIPPLINRLTSYEGLGQKITFGQQLARVEEQLDELPPAQTLGRTEPHTTQPVGGEPSAEYPVRESSVRAASGDGYIAIAQLAPSAAILGAWADVETALTALGNHYAAAEAVQYRSAKAFKKRPSPASPRNIMNWLSERGLIPNPVARILNDQWMLRASVAHGKHEPTVGEAIAYVDAAQKVRDILVTLANIPDDKAEEIASDNRADLADWIDLFSSLQRTRALSSSDSE